MDVHEQMIVEWECKRLSYAFAHHIDNAEFEAMIALLTDDGVFDRAGQVSRGHDELRKAMHERPPATTRHMFTNFHFLRVEADSAEAVFSCMSYHGFGDPSEGPVVFATVNGRLLQFHNHYRKTADGWRIDSQIARVIFKPEAWP